MRVRGCAHFQPAAPTRPAIARFRVTLPRPTDLHCTARRLLCTPCACPESHAEGPVSLVEKRPHLKVLPRASDRIFRLTAPLPLDGEPARTSLHYTRKNSTFPPRKKYDALSIGGLFACGNSILPDTHFEDRFGCLDLRCGGFLID